MPEEDLFNEEVEVTTDVPESAVVNEFRSKITIGDVETLDFGEDAYVTNSGTAEDPVLDFGIPRGASGTIWGQLDGTLSDQTDLQNALDAISTSVSGKADLASPTFTGTPTAPTAIADTNTNQIATTAFVKNAITVLRNYVDQAVSNVLKTMDWSNAVSMTLASNGTTSYTCPSNGYVVISDIIKSGTWNGYVTINGARISPNTSESLVMNNVFNVSNNDIFLWNYINGSGSCKCYLTFIPFSQ